MDSGITVTGSGTVVAPPDVVKADLTTESTGAGMQDALDGATHAAQRVRDALLEAGVGENEIATSDVNVWPEHDHMHQLVGYRAALSLTALLRNLDTATELLQQVIEQGGAEVRFGGMTMQHSDPDGLVGRAREAAWRDARARAEQYASLAGRALGAVVAVTEVSGGFDLQPVQVGYGEDGEEAASYPQAQSASVTLTAVWSLA